MFGGSALRKGINVQFLMLLVLHRIEKALNSCNATTGNIIETTERLKRELDVNTQRQEIVSCFLRDYQLSNEEVQDLTDGFEPAH